MKNLYKIAHLTRLSTGDGLRQKNGEQFKNFGGQSILRFGALCDKHLEKRGRSFLQTAAQNKATGGVTPVAAQLTRFSAGCSWGSLSLSLSFPFTFARQALGSQFGGEQTSCLLLCLVVSESYHAFLLLFKQALGTLFFCLRRGHVRQRLTVHGVSIEKRAPA
jgi:hypothetical protein